MVRIDLIGRLEAELQQSIEREHILLNNDPLEREKYNRNDPDFVLLEDDIRCFENINNLEGEDKIIKKLHLCHNELKIISKLYQLVILTKEEYERKISIFN